MDGWRPHPCAEIRCLQPARGALALSACCFGLLNAVTVQAFACLFWKRGLRLGHWLVLSGGLFVLGLQLLALRGSFAARLGACSLPPWQAAPGSSMSTRCLAAGSSLAQLGVCNSVHWWLFCASQILVGRCPFMLEGDGACCLTFHLWLSSVIVASLHASWLETLLQRNLHAAASCLVAVCAAYPCHLHSRSGFGPSGQLHLVSCVLLLHTGRCPSSVPCPRCCGWWPACTLFVCNRCSAECRPHCNGACACIV